MKNTDIAKKNRNRLILESVLVVLTIVLTVAQIAIASHFEMPETARILLIIIALIEMTVGIVICAALEMSVGGFECSKCGHYFVPTKTAYLMGAHTIMRRRLRCPKCGVRNWARRRLAPPEQNEE